MPASKLYTTTISLLLIFLFSYTAIDKLMHLQMNRVVLSHMPYINHMAAYIAVAVPAVEIITVLLLMHPVTNRTGLYASFVLMLLFTMYLATMLVVNSKLPCTCGGILQQLSWKQHVLFNLVIMVLVVVDLGIGNKSYPTSKLTALHTRHS